MWGQRGLVCAGEGGSDFYVVTCRGFSGKALFRPNCDSCPKTGDLGK